MTRRTPSGRVLPLASAPTPADSLSPPAPLAWVQADAWLTAGAADSARALLSLLRPVGATAQSK